MRKVFWDDPYQKSLVTKVASVLDNRIVPEETIVFSFSGGQESDKATINGMPVIDSDVEGNSIYYELQEGHGFKSGDTITMEIDWLRRYKLMRLHFAAELVLEIVTRKWGFEKIGAHIAEEKSRIDFVSDKNIAALFDEILAEYNAIIKKDAPIKTGFSDIESQKRFWEIDGFSKIPCGGTHVKSTAEVGYVTLKKKKYRQIERKNRDSFSIARMT